MTSGSLDDDRTETEAAVAPLDSAAARVGSDDFVDSILSMAERRADGVELGEVTQVAASDRPVVATPVSSRIASGDFVDDVLEVAETRALAALKESAEKRPSIPRAIPASTSQTPQRRGLRASVSDTVTPTVGTARTLPADLAPPVEVHVAPLPADDLVVEVDVVETIQHVHPSRPTPWWRKRPSLEIIFAVIATVLMVIGLALVIAELF
jgi:hypothetical protein